MAANSISSGRAADAEWRVPGPAVEPQSSDTGAGAATSEGDAAGFSDGRLPGTGDRCIPSRYVEGLRSALDPAAQQQHIARGFREALHIAGDAARRALDDAEDRLLTALEGLSSTRKRGHMLRNFSDVRQMREEAESAVERWSAMSDLVKRLTEELDEHAGLFTEKCCIAMAEVTDEVKRAPWDHPAIDPWGQVPSLNASLLELARDTPATSISKTSFRVVVAQTWTAEGALQRHQKAAEEAKEAAAAAAAALAAVPAAVDSVGGADASDQTVMNASITSGTSRPPASAASPGNMASPAGSPKALRSSVGGGGVAASPGLGPSDSPVCPLAGDMSAFESAAEPPSQQTRQANIERVLKRALPPLKITCMAADESGPAPGDSGDSPPTQNGVSASWDLIFIGAADGSVLGITPARLKEPLGDDVVLAAAQGRSRNGSTGDRQRRAGAARSGPGSPAGKRSGLASSPAGGGKPKTGGGKGVGHAGATAAAAVGGPEDPLNSGPYRNVPGVRVYPGHVYAVTKLLAFTHKDLRMIASASADKTVRVSNVVSRELLFVFAENRAAVLSLAYHRQLHRLVAACADGSIHLWEPRFGEESTMVANKQRFGVVTCVAVSSNMVAKAMPAAATAAAMPSPSGIGTAHRTSMAAAAAVPPRLVAGTRTGAVFVLEPVMPGSMLYQPNDVLCVGAAVAPNGYVSAELGLDEGAICREGHTAGITAVEAPHHPYVFTGDESGVANLFDISRMARLRRFHGHVDAISALAVTSDGFMITASHDATIIAWSWRDGAQLHRLAHHFHRINGLLLGVLPKARVDVAALIASSNNAMRSHGASDDRWPGSNAIALRYLPGVAECTMFSAAFDGTIGIATASYDMSS